jgi:hypothetical protein
MTPEESAQPATKRAKFTAYTLAEDIWLLDFSEQNPNVNAEDCGAGCRTHVRMLSHALCALPHELDPRF